MRISRIFIGGIIVFSSSAFSSNLENPFLKPSERINLASNGQANECEIHEVERFERNEMLIDEMREYVPEHDPAVLGNWTRREVEESRYIGQVDDEKLYFNEEKKVYITLDLTKSRNYKG